MFGIFGFDLELLRKMQSFFVRYEIGGNLSWPILRHYFEMTKISTKIGNMAQIH